MARPRGALTAQCRTLKAHREDGRCESGHDLTRPGALLNYSGYILCAQCKTVYMERNGYSNERWCRRGLHPMPKGVRRCARCLEIYPKKRSTYSYLHQGFPPDEVLRGAACRPGDALLFDEREQYETKVAAGKRNAVARRICLGCPVAAACLTDAVANLRSGVFGGQSLAKGVAVGVVLTVPVVPNSTPCETPTG